ncbi:MAG: cytochrome c [Verrucomicrobia bacterium]|nr:cytochrome c [Verrucomicrobiota bacterium]
MRYFLLIFVLAIATVLGTAGYRGTLTRKSPLELFPDMKRQAKLRPQSETHNLFWEDNRGSRLPISGTVSRNSPYEDTPLNTGRITGTTNFVELNPLPVTRELLERGRERFQISCSPCHGAQGDGKGITTQYGMAGVVADLHDAKTKKIVQQPDGEIFNTISNGKNTMGAYAPNIAIEDRWAIVAYVRALQLSRLANVDEIPADKRAALKK